MNCHCLKAYLTEGLADEARDAYTRAARETHGAGPVLKTTKTREGEAQKPKKRTAYSGKEGVSTGKKKEPAYHTACQRSQGGKHKKEKKRVVLR